MDKFDEGLENFGHVEVKMVLDAGGGGGGGADETLATGFHLPTGQHMRGAYPGGFGGKARPLVPFPAQLPCSSEAEAYAETSVRSGRRMRRACTGTLVHHERATRLSRKEDEWPGQGAEGGGCGECVRVLWYTISEQSG